jgi:hypothetical protein
MCIAAPVPSLEVEFQDKIILADRAFAIRRAVEIRIGDGIAIVEETQGPSTARC